jgi:hypothetical protein
VCAVYAFQDYLFPCEPDGRLFCNEPFRLVTWREKEAFFGSGGMIETAAVCRSYSKAGEKICTNPSWCVHIALLGGNELARLCSSYFMECCGDDLI